MKCADCQHLQFETAHHQMTIFSARPVVVADCELTNISFDIDADRTCKTFKVLSTVPQPIERAHP